MRIAMLGHKRIPSREGGVEVVVEELAVRMAEQGHIVTCYNRIGHHISGKEYDSYTQKQFKGVQLKRVPAIRVKGLAAMTASFFASLRATFGRYDIVHFHTEGPCATLWLTKLFGKRCVVTVHGLDHQRSKWGRFAKAYIMLGEKCAARFADEIIVLSRSVQDYFLEKYQRHTWYIPNGVSVAEPKEAKKICDSFCLQKEGYILFLGRITPEKGIHYLIDAFHGVKTDKKLVIAGGISDSEGYSTRLKQMAGDDKRIIFTGFVQGEMLAELFSNAYLYVLPSDLEGMPLSLLEAMSYGNCCLVSDIPECADVIGDAGITFRKSSMTDLQQKLQWLCDNAEMTQRYKKSAVQCIGEKYSWDEVTADTLSVYEKRVAHDQSTSVRQ